MGLMLRRVPISCPTPAGLPLHCKASESAGDSKAIFKLRTGRNLQLRQNSATASYRDITRYAREIADPRFLPDNRVAHHAAIDGRIGADLGAVLNNDPANPWRPGKPMKGRGASMVEIDTWLTDAHPRMQDNPITDQRMGNRCLRPDSAIAADADIRTDDAVRANNRTGTNFRVGANDHPRIDDHMLFETCLGMNSKRLD